MTDAHSSTEGSNFIILRPDLAEKVWQHLTAIRIAPPSEKLDAWTRAAQLVVGLIGPDFPQSEAVDRLWATAETDVVLRTYDTNILQAKLAEGLSNPIFLDEVDDIIEDGARPSMQATPQVTIEAIMYCVRERGLPALKEPANIERLTRCDRAARTEINERIARLIAKKEIAA